MQVSDVRVSTGRATRIDSDLQVGDLVYTDRAYTFTDVGALAGTAHILLPQEDKYVGGNAYLTFSINVPATVSVLLDKRTTSLPAWLNGFAKTTQTVRTTDAATIMEVYQKDYPAGTVVLGGPGRQGNGSHYAVAVGSAQTAPKGWTYAKIGAGGFVTGGDVAADGTTIFRTDTSGAYIYDDATGEFHMVVPQNLAPEYLAAWNATGVFEALIAHSNSRVLYVAYDTGSVLFGGTIFKSTDRGATWTAVLMGLSFNSNGGSMRTMHRHGDIDPRNPNHVIFGDQRGLHRTIDGGATWTRVTGVPAPIANPNEQVGYTGVAFNLSGPQVNGRTAEMMVSVDGRFWRSQDGGETWRDVSAGGPGKSPRMAEYDDRGAYYASNGGLWRFENGSWTNLKCPSDWLSSFAIDPRDSNRILVGRGNIANFSYTTDRGVTWAGANWHGNGIRSVDNIGWHDRAMGKGYLGNSYIMDATRRTVWISGGNQGIASFDFDGAIAAHRQDFYVDAHGIGIEQICINRFILPAGSSKVHLALWDEGYGQLTRDNSVYPAVLNPMHNFSATWGLDVSKEDPRFLVRLMTWDTDDPALSGWSADDGATWTPFAALPPTPRGSTIAISGRDNMIIVPSASAAAAENAPHYTLDRGRTWKPINLGVPWTKERTAGIQFVYYLDRQIVTADATQLGTFYFLSTSQDDALLGLWRTRDGGVTWELRHPGLPTPAQRGVWGFNAKIVSPRTNHLWLTAGPAGPDGTAGPESFHRSFDGGQTITPLVGVREVAAFGFGAPAPAGSGYPTLYIVGYVDNVLGVFMSTNADADTPSWVNLGTYANGGAYGVRDVAGDPDHFGRVWVAQGCAGAAYGDFSSLF